jgi:PKD repeat protein
MRRPGRLAVALGPAASSRRLKLRSAAAVTIGLALVVLTAQTALAQPANDDFANATVIDPSSLPFTDTVDTTQATTEADEPPSGCFYSGGTVWYSFTSSSSGVFRVDTSASDYSNAINIYSGSSLPALSFVACGYWFERPTFRATAGTTYYVQVGGYFESGTLQLLLSQVPPPPNDDFANATAIDALPFDDTQSALAATTESGEPSPSCAPNTPSNSWWYAFAPNASGSFTASLASGTWSTVAVYTGPSLADLSQVACVSQGGAVVAFHADAGTTYYLQVSDVYGGSFGPISLQLDIAPQPVAAFGYSPSEPSMFDTVGFNSQSSDPGGGGIQSLAWSFGDGATAEGCCPTHQYARDGDYTVGLTVTTPDGRTGSTTQVVQVRTHDVAITKIGLPKSAHVGQTIAINVYLRNTRQAETVEVGLFRTVPGGFQQVGSLTQSVAVKSGNRTTLFASTNTITQADRSVGKVSFKAVASIVDHRDAFPADNELTSPPVKVT